MTEIINILLGLQIGIQLVAAYFVFKIIKIETTPYLPYILAFIALLLMVLIRLDLIFTIMPPAIKISVQTSISFLWMIAFIKIYYLVQNK